MPFWKDKHIGRLSEPAHRFRELFLGVIQNEAGAESPGCGPVCCLLAVFSGTTKGRRSPGHGIRPVHQGARPGAAALPCSALLRSTCFFFPGFLFSAIYLGLAWFGGEPVKAFGQCRPPPHPWGSTCSSGLSPALATLVPPVMGHARPTQHCPSLSALPTLPLCLSVRLSVCPLTPGPC